VQDVVGDPAHVQTVGDLDRTVRLARAAQLLDVRTEVADRQGAGDLLAEVVEQPVAADPGDVLWVPDRGPVPELGELGGQELGPLLGEPDEGVDAVDERGRGPLGAARSRSTCSGPKTSARRPSPRRRQKSICQSRSRAALKPCARKTSYVEDP
jgi:hypothetical protein